jgi:hypothetical protein
MQAKKIRTADKYFITFASFYLIRFLGNAKVFSTKEKTMTTYTVRTQNGRESRISYTNLAEAIIDATFNIDGRMASCVIKAFKGERFIGYAGIDGEIGEQPNAVILFRR